MEGLDFVMGSGHIGYRDLAKLAVAIEHELTRQTITHTPTKEAAMLIPA